MSVSTLTAAAYGRALALRDLTDRALGPHAMQLLVSDAIAALQREWRCPVVVYRAPPVVSIADNYDRLHYPRDAVARDTRYTRYVSETSLLRSQTSAMIPEALRTIASANYDEVLVVCVGLTYRRDSIDRLHVGEPHQLDLWRIRRGAVARPDLERMIHVVIGALLPGATARMNETEHPYTLQGLEVYAELEERSIEVLECGLTLPEILRESGYDASHTGLAHAGLAMGIGLDRVLMLRKGIDDIRLLRSTDSRVVAQMLDLEPYRPVSSQPPIRRDLSIAVTDSMSAEEIGDRVRASLGADVDSIETIEVVAETPYAELPSIARERLGLDPNQKNVLLKFGVRDLERTLTSDEANVLRDRIYAALHRGTVRSWASSLPTQG